MLHTLDRTIEVTPGKTSRILGRKTFEVIERYRQSLRRSGWSVHTGTMTNLGTGAVTYYICAHKIVLDCNCKPSKGELRVKLSPDVQRKLDGWKTKRSLE